MKGSTEVPMSLALRVGVALYIATLNLILLSVLVVVWPEADRLSEAIRFFRYSVTLSPDARLLVLVAITGAFGSTIHLASSFAEHAGRGQLERSWGWWYLLRPTIGLTLAVMMYLVLRGGLVVSSSTAASASINPYGVCAIAALAGLCSRQATRKLKEVFEQLFRTASTENMSES